MNAGMLRDQVLAHPAGTDDAAGVEDHHLVVLCGGAPSVAGLRGLRDRGLFGIGGMLAPNGAAPAGGLGFALAASRGART